MIKTFLVKIETESRYVYDKQKTPWKVLCTVFIHSSFRNIKLTRSLRSLVRFMILHDSWIKTVRTHFPWSILYIFPFLTYSLSTWRSIYKPPSSLLWPSKKALGIIKFSSYNSHSTPLFHKLAIFTLDNLICFNIALFMNDYNSNALSTSFHKFFACIKEVHQYSTRLTVTSLKQEQIMELSLFVWWVQLNWYGIPSRMI